MIKNRKLSCISAADLEFLVGEIFALIDTTCILLLFPLYLSSNLPIYLKYWFQVMPLEISQIHLAKYLFSAKMLNSAQIPWVALLLILTEKKHGCKEVSFTRLVVFQSFWYLSSSAKILLMQLRSTEPKRKPQWITWMWPKKKKKRYFFHPFNSV